MPNTWTKSYQTVIAGRVREDEAYFFHYNLIAVPSGTWRITPCGAKTQPHIDMDPMFDEGMGKKPSGILVGAVPNTDTVRRPLLSAYLPNKYNVGA